jgi:hypothetical protein
VCSKEAADGNSLFGGVAEEEEASPFRLFLAVDAMLENFRVNGLCDGALLADRQNALEEALSSDSSAERDLLLAADEAGGCLVIDEPIPVGRYMVTALWFQNPTFRLNGYYLLQIINIKNIN